jgi:thiol-disulfide isomerase/thioredoxin
MNHFISIYKIGWVLLPCFLLSAGAKGQSDAVSPAEELTISFRGKYDQRQDRRGHGMMPIFKLRNDSIFFGDTAYHVRYPSSFAAEKVAVSTNYFTGSQDNPLGKTIPYLIYPYDSPFPSIYQDTTYSFNFLNAERFDFQREDSTIVVISTNWRYTDCKFPVEYQKPHYKDAEEKELIETYFGSNRHLGKNELTDANHWLENRRMNYRFSEFSFRDSTYAIGLYDYNCNGTYDDEGEDMILLGNTSSPLSEDRSKNGFLYQKSGLISHQGYSFRVVSVAKSGASVTLSPTGFTNQSLGFRLGSSLSDIEAPLNVRDGTPVPSLISTTHPYTLFDVWGTWCKGCIVQLPQLKELVGSKNDQIKIVGLNYGDDLNEIEAFEEKHETSWASWRIDDATLEKLAISGFPSFLVLDRDGKLVFKTTSVVELKAFFD